MARHPGADRLVAAILHNSGEEESTALHLAGCRDDKDGRKSLRSLAASLREGRSGATPAAVQAAAESARRLQARPPLSAVVDAPPSLASSGGSRREVRLPVAPPGMVAGDSPEQDPTQLGDVEYWEVELRELTAAATDARGNAALQLRKAAHAVRGSLEQARRRDETLRAIRTVRELRDPRALVGVLRKHVRALAAVAPSELRAFVREALAALPAEVAS